MPKYFDTDNCRPCIIFHTAVWCKLHTLVQNTNTECAISGFVNKIDNNYIIYDVSVYPQIVKAAEVVIDEDLYAPWLLQFSDEKIATMRFQMHSHVRMATSPSATDTATWLELAKTAKDFFIFMILNKSGDFSLCLYDCEKRLIFEKGDLDIDYMLHEGITTNEWYDEKCAQMLKEPVALVPIKTIKPPKNKDKDKNKQNYSFTEDDELLPWNPERRYYGFSET